VPSSNIRVGLLAYGAIGHEHNLAVQATDGLVLAAVCDTNPERVAAALELAPEATPFEDASAMLDSGTIDLVVVSTPPDSHFSWAKAALQRGIHVILEKPMALTAEQCDELMALADSSGRLLVVYQNRRYDRDFATLAAGIRSRLYTLPDGTLVLPGHGPSTTVGHERRHNPFVNDGGGED
jgi:predicted dehydrogenase